jgi:hypothetical protein
MNAAAYTDASLQRLDHEIAEAKIRRQAIERERLERVQENADRAHRLIMFTALEAFRPYARPIETLEHFFQVRFDLPNFSIMAQVTKKMTSERIVQWHWTRRTVWHHVYTLDEALVYGAEQGSQWIDVPPPF